MKKDSAKSPSTLVVRNAKWACTPALDISQAVTDVLSLLRTERQREILARRLGLFGDKDSLKTLSRSYDMSMANVYKIVQQARTALKSAAASDAEPYVEQISQPLQRTLRRAGGASRVDDLAIQLGLRDDAPNQRRLLFLADVCPDLHVIKEDAAHCAAVSLCDPTTTATIIERIVTAIKRMNEPATTAQVARSVRLPAPFKAPTFAVLSKQLATLHGRWGLASWPTVNPRTITDKISDVLRGYGQPVHFAEIARRVQSLTQPGSTVSARSVHNELVRDASFVAVARGTYALRAWGYPDGSISDLITDVLREADRPLRSTEIVKRVLERRPHLKESSIQAKLCGQPQFERTAPATYQLNEQAARAALRSLRNHRLTRRSDAK